MWDMFFYKTHRGPAPYTRRRAMHRSRLDMRGADAGAGGMSISSGSGSGGGASGMGASSSSSEAMAQSTRSSGAGSWLDVLGEEIIAGMERRGFCHSIAGESAVAVGAQATPMSQRSVTARAAHSAEDWRRHAFMAARVASLV